MDEDYTGPIWTKDEVVRAGYLTIDNTRIVAQTQEIPNADGSVLVLLDLAENGDVLGVEVLW